MRRAECPQHRSGARTGWTWWGPLPQCRTSKSNTRAFDEKVESLIVDSHDGANRIQDPHWNKGASHEWGSLIPTICANVSLRQSKPVIPARKLLSATTLLLVPLALSSILSTIPAVSVHT